MHHPGRRSGTASHEPYAAQRAALVQPQHLDAGVHSNVHMGHPPGSVPTTPPPLSRHDALRSPAMSGRGDSEISERNEEVGKGEEPEEIEELEELEEIEEARRARWTATATGSLLTLAGLAAALLRLTGSAPALVPAAYALGAAVCALAAVLGSRGRTRRALWLLIAGVMVMAFGDQSD